VGSTLSVIYIPCFYPSQIFADKARGIPKGAPLRLD